MPYQPGAVVHGVTHIADVYKSGNVYANNVKVALWNPPGLSEAFIFDPIVPQATAADVINQALAEAAAAASNPPSVPAESVVQGGVESGYQGTPVTEVTTSTGVITAAVSTDFVSWMAARIDEGKRGMWTRVSKPAPAAPASKADSNKNIMGMWASIGLNYYANHDQTAWCMGWLNWGLKQNGYVWCKEASSWAIRNKPQKWNAVSVPLDQGQPGDIALWSFGHVSFIYKVLSPGRYTFCGGNQGGKDITNNNPLNSTVSESWPSGYKLPGNGTLVGLWRPSKVAPT